jgi:hypothetical protein
MPRHLDRGCDVFATQQRRTGCKWDIFTQANAACRNNILHVLIAGPPPKFTNAYLHFRAHAPLALYRAGKSCSYCRKATGPNRPAIQGETVMKLGAAIAEIMKREGIEILCGYPVNHLIEYAANADIRPVMVRQERIGVHMADAISRVTSGQSIGAFCMQHGPGAENR